MDFNKVIIVGNLTRDPELRTMPNGTSVCNVAIASNRAWISKESGEKQTEVEYHNIVIFSKMGENVAKYMKKGSKMLVEGRLKTQSWEDKQTKTKKYRTEVIAEKISFGSNANNNNYTSQPAPKDDVSQPDPEEEISVEDIPF